jgi:hypothetical protein
MAQIHAPIRRAVEAAGGAAAGRSLPFGGGSDPVTAAYSLLLDA